MNKKEFKEITEILFTNYSKQLNVHLLELWYNELKEYNKDEYKKIINKIITKETFMPSLAKIKSYLDVPSWNDDKIETELATEEEIKELTEKIEKIIKKY